MKLGVRKAKEIQKDIQEVLKEVSAGKLNSGAAADKIVCLREEMESVVDHLKKSK